MNEIIFTELDKKPIKKYIDFLYELLKDRKFSISHNVLPPYEEHKDFVLSHPYYKWVIISSNTSMIGSIYFQYDNSIGLHLLSKFNHLTYKVLSEFELNFKPLKAVKSLRSSTFSFNVSPDDELRKKILFESGYKIISLVFEKNI